MTEQQNALKVLAYIILGLLALAVVVRVVWFLLGLTVTLIKVAIIVAVAVVVGYLVYHLIRSAARQL